MNEKAASGRFDVDLCDPETRRALKEMGERLARERDELSVERRRAEARVEERIRRRALVPSGV